MLTPVDLAKCGQPDGTGVTIDRFRENVMGEIFEGR
jgi:hypothetical protein